MPQNPPSPQDSNPSQTPGSGSGSGGGERGAVQGEGDYEAARRYREEVKEYLEHSNVDERARAAKPDSAKQERELALAEEQGKTRSKGDDPVDVGLMYPGKRAEDAPTRDAPDSNTDKH
jgi:hypothetical protein